MDSSTLDTSNIVRIANAYGNTLDGIHESNLFHYFSEGQPYGAPDLLRSDLGAIGRVARKSFESGDMHVCLEISVLNESFGLMKVKEECAGQELGWVKINAEATVDGQKVDTVADIDLCTCGKMHLSGGWLDDDFKQGQELFDQLGISGHLLANDTQGDVGTIGRGEVYLSMDQSAKVSSFVAKTFLSL